ncbi:isoprenylcysteine carboxylmethyltransferase family protein [Mesorhizobium sp. PAMC28654]|uniref:methyltransferase family protein n=1 Tax=Mesorhizobium sp. PAMC28654 TaxID=2880934 RepID=UPI001D09BAA3|nr:isoprenylcysteine carboxylmethyltransferase family protein [Mesorhizobium sp. PAMC28654]UDL89536.1 isoprenylcysteine carboxylmethyltransferase family protein [Mesorhizobium sp. PAMC28654]
MLISKNPALPDVGQKRTLTEARKREIITDVREALFRTATLLVAGFFVYRGVYHLVIDPTRLNVLLLTISETLTFVWLLLSRRPSVRDWNPLTVVVTMFASFGVGFVILDPGVAIIPLYVAAPLQFLALWVVIWGKVSLGRSFALLPANRGVVTGGAYRWVRHPIYGGYLIGHCLFLLSSFSLFNLTVYSLVTCMQLHRILREEAILARTPEYQDYMSRVRYRLFYGIF